MRLHERISDFKREKKTGAGGLEIEAERTLRAEPVLQNAPGAREDIIRRDRSDDDRIDLFPFDSGHIERLQTCFIRKVARRLFGRSDAPLLNPGTGTDPFVVGLDHFLEIRIAQNPFRNIRSGTCYSDAHVTPSEA